MVRASSSAKKRARGGIEASGASLLGLFSWSRREAMEMVKVEAVVIRERVETVIDAVEQETGHVGVTVLEAIGHGRQRGITHEYRGRVFESRFLPKAQLVLVVADDIADDVVATIVDSARSGNESGDGIVWTTPVANVTHNRTGRSLEEVEVR
jgi:nitrogen regulatory protein PII